MLISLILNVQSAKGIERRILLFFCFFFLCGHQDSPSGLHYVLSRSTIREATRTQSLFLVSFYLWRINLTRKTEQMAKISCH